MAAILSASLALSACITPSAPRFPYSAGDRPLNRSIVPPDFRSSVSPSSNRPNFTLDDPPLMVRICAMSYQKMRSLGLERLQRTTLKARQTRDKRSKPLRKGPFLGYYSPSASTTHHSQTHHTFPPCPTKKSTFIGTNI